MTEKGLIDYRKEESHLSLIMVTKRVGNFCDTDTLLQWGGEDSKT